MQIKNNNIRSIIQEIWAVSWPTAFIMFYEFLIGLTDVYVASRFGKEAQAAYGFSFQVYFVFIILGIALSIGTVSVVSRLFMSDKQDEFKTAVSTCITAAAIGGAVFMFIGVFLSRYFINAINLPLGVKTLAVPFVKIYSLAFIFDYVLMNNNSILRSCRMVKKSLWIMSGICIMNIILDFVFAFKTPLGLNGIATATVMSLFTGAVLSMYFTGKLAGVFRFSTSVVKHVLSISWPAGLLQVFMQVGYLVLFSILGMLPAHNTEIMAALTNGLKIESAIFMPAVAFNMGAAVVVGNFLGKKDEQGAFKSGILTAIIGMAIVFFITALIMLNARHIASFLSDNAIVAKESVRYIYIALIGEPFLAWGIILGGALNGAGDTRTIMIITFVSIWLVRLPLCFIIGIHYAFGSVAIWWCMNISIFIQALLITKRYYSKKWISVGLQI